MRGKIDNTEFISAGMNFGRVPPIPEVKPNSRNICNLPWNPDDFFYMSVESEDAFIVKDGASL